MIIKVSDIENAREGILNIDFEEIIEDFNGKTPVKAQLKAELQSSIIRITGEVQAEVNLICDYCLEEFTKEYKIKAEEYFERYKLNPETEREFEVKDENFVQDLDGKDEIDITDLIYQIITLHIPNQIVCGINCKGKEKLSKYMHEDLTDPRLEIFKTIKTDKE